ncbi:hypothetical protein LIA77_02950 [Sarocladium implicatum]|nr:hypothetical protein LIA77_02950 [Sarocladium implicatum]
MASQDDQQRTARIITHMNSQHRRELTHYLLQHHPSLPSRHASPAALKAITLDSMTITDRNGVEHIVPINPPLGTWADARTRLADMDAEARVHLGLSPVSLDTYSLPRFPTEALVAFSVLFYVFCYVTLPLVVPGSTAFRLLDAYWPAPRGALSYRRLVKALFWPVLGIHAAETVLLDRLRMRPYGVQRFSRLWWTWELSCFIEGFGSFARSKAIVEKKMEEKEKASKGH